MTESIFEDIPGMGPKRIQKLWKEFESLEAIQESSLQEIEKRTHFSKKLSSSILECQDEKFRKAFYSKRPSFRGEYDNWLQGRVFR